MRSPGAACISFTNCDITTGRSLQDDGVYKATEFRRAGFDEVLVGGHRRPVLAPVGVVLEFSHVCDPDDLHHLA